MKRANFTRLHRNFPSAASENNMFHFKNCHNITFGFFEILSNYFSALAFFPLPLLSKKKENKVRYKTFKNSAVTEKKNNTEKYKKI